MNTSDSSTSQATIYTHMQAAVDIVQSSAHITNKIAATIAGEGFAFSQTNHWPQAIADTLGTETKIGNSSGTIHAEMACIFTAINNNKVTKDASMFITDPPCPNCMKNMALSGISNLYIDHKGFDKDWATRRGNHFETMSLRIAETYGMEVSIIHRKAQKYEVISTPNTAPRSHDASPATLTPITPQQADTWHARPLANTEDNNANTPFASTIATGKNGATYFITAPRHALFNPNDKTIENPHDKYSFFIEPLNHLLMTCARHGVSPIPKTTMTSQTPSARELVNYIGSSHNYLYILNENLCRDPHGKEALTLLRNNNILSILNL